MHLKIDKHLVFDISRIAFFIIFFSAMAVFVGRPEVREHIFNINALREILQGRHEPLGHLFSALLFILLLGGLIAAGIPRLWASALGGIIYGAFMGTIISLLASILGASLLYIAGRSFLADVVDRRVGKKAKTWKQRFQDNGFWWVIYGRFIPFTNSTLMSLLCGSCRVPFIDFFLGSIIGFIPLAAVFATYGSGGVKGNLLQIALATILLILSILLRKVMDKRLSLPVKKIRAQ